MAIEMKCDFCSNGASAVVRTKLAVNIEKEHNVCKKCYKQMKGLGIVKKL